MDQQMGEAGAAMERIEALVSRLDGFADSPDREIARGIAADLIQFYREGFARLLEQTVGAAEAGLAAIESLAASDSLFSSLLLLHGLHPVDVQTRVRRAVERLDPALHAAVARIELEGSDKGNIRVRLRAGGRSAMKLRAMLQDALDEAAPDAAATVLLEAPTPSAQFVPVGAITIRRSRGS